MIRQEQETIILWDEVKDGLITLYTCSRRLAQIAISEGASPSNVTYIDGKAVAWWFELQKTARSRKILMAVLPGFRKVLANQ
ncbi:MAG: hypothetical protein A4E56_00390 [Pelotomaculum sp. PtaU1.Bin065]|nr:MAG: hypothetical protein A4E56_00390 [Pelotomaculum sp. PtaU1.Bin065]